MVEPDNRQCRRQFSRIDIDAELIFSDKEKHWQSKLIDISLNGALINRPPGWNGELQDRYHMKVMLDADTYICMDVSVAHIRDQCIGLCCQCIDVEDICILRRLVELNIGDTTLLQRELSMLLKNAP